MAFPRTYTPADISFYYAGTECVSCLDTMFVIQKRLSADTLYDTV